MCSQSFTGASHVANHRGHVPMQDKVIVALGQDVSIKRDWMRFEVAWGAMRRLLNGFLPEGLREHFLRPYFARFVRSCPFASGDSDLYRYKGQRRIEDGPDDYLP